MFLYWQKSAYLWVYYCRNICRRHQVRHLRLSIGKYFPVERIETCSRPQSDPMGPNQKTGTSPSRSLSFAISLADYHIDNCKGNTWEKECVCILCFSAVWLVDYHIDNCKGKIWEKKCVCILFFSAVLLVDFHIDNCKGLKGRHEKRNVFVFSFSLLYLLLKS